MSRYYGSVVKLVAVLLLNVRHVVDPQEARRERNVESGTLRYLVPKKYACFIFFLTLIFYFSMCHTCNHKFEQ